LIAAAMGLEGFMTKLLERGIKAVGSLPADRQDLAGALLLELANRTTPEYTLTPDQVEDLKAALKEADRGTFASPEQVDDAWRKFGR
jgi:hypothetical protein